MPNANYRAGRAFEYRRKKFYEAQGFTVLRTAGSHGPFDLVLIAPNVHVTLVQCKKTPSQTIAQLLIRKFATNPPLPPSGKYRQQIDVSVASLRKVLSEIV